VFQFHNGSIKTQQSGYAKTIDEVFQFHNGSIKTIMAQLLAMGLNMFQFHNGSIKTVGCGWLETASLYVSIPQWFD